MKDIPSPVWPSPTKRITDGVLGKSEAITGASSQPLPCNGSKLETSESDASAPDCIMEGKCNQLTYTLQNKSLSLQ